MEGNCTDEILYTPGMNLNLHFVHARRHIFAWCGPYTFATTSPPTKKFYTFIIHPTSTRNITLTGAERTSAQYPDFESKLDYSLKLNRDLSKCKHLHTVKIVLQRLSVDAGIPVLQTLL